MIKAFSIWTVLGLSVLGSGLWAAKTGYGIPSNVKNPPSIREESSDSRNSSMRRRYFIGGGIHRGK